MISLLDASALNCIWPSLVARNHDRVRGLARLGSKGRDRGEGDDRARIGLLAAGDHLHGISFHGADELDSRQRSRALVGDLERVGRRLAHLENVGPSSPPSSSRAQILTTSVEQLVATGAAQVPVAVALMAMLLMPLGLTVKFTVLLAPAARLPTFHATLPPPAVPPSVR